MEKAYKDIRLAIHDFEVLLERVAVRSDRESKLADKSIVLMKVGAKMLKRIVRERGIKGPLKVWKEPAE